MLKRLTTHSRLTTPAPPTKCRDVGSTAYGAAPLMSFRMTGRLCFAHLACHVLSSTQMAVGLSAHLITK